VVTAVDKFDLRIVINEILKQTKGDQWQARHGMTKGYIFDRTYIVYVFPLWLRGMSKDSNHNVQVKRIPLRNDQ
jgi:hypothetical protein